MQRLDELLSDPWLAGLAGLATFLVAWLLLRVAHGLARRYLRSLAERSDPVPMPVEIAIQEVAATKGWFLALMAALASSRFLSEAPAFTALLGRAVVIGLLIQIGIWITAACSAYLRRRRRLQLEQDPGAVAAMDVLGFVTKVVVWTVVVLLMLDNLGVNVTTLIAGLGIGGVALALAAQQILGDLFASLSIVLDKPFAVGDLLAIGEYQGRVERVGLKTTRLRSVSGEQIVFSNADLLSSRIRNFGRMSERRVVMHLNVSYETAVEVLQRIPELLRQTIEAKTRVRFARAHFQRYGEFGLIFEAVYFVLSPDHDLHMDIQQSINFAVFERFAKEGITIAQPLRAPFVPPAAGSTPS